MRQWELWKFPFPSADRPHWFVILSPDVLINQPGQIRLNGLICTTLRPVGRDAKRHEVRLDAADGFDWDTVVKCSYVHELPTDVPAQHIGAISRVRRQEIVRRLNEYLFS